MREIYNNTINIVIKYNEILKKHKRYARSNQPKKFDDFPTLLKEVKRFSFFILWTRKKNFFLKRHKKTKRWLSLLRPDDDEKGQGNISYFHI